MRSALILAIVFSLGAGPLGLARLSAASQDGASVRAVRDLLNVTQAITVFDHVTATAEGGTITLAGKVTSKAKRDQLETEVATVPGVKQIVNRIRVLSSSSSDESLRQNVARAIYRHPSFRSYAAMTHPPIRILVDRGRVTLAGEVKTSVEKLVAQSIAEAEAKGNVTDELIVTR